MNRHTIAAWISALTFWMLVAAPAFSRQTAATELFTLRGHGSRVASIAFSPDGQRIVTGSFDNTAKVWDATSGKLLFTLSGHSDAVVFVAFSPDCRRIATRSQGGHGSRNRTARIWDAASGKLLLHLGGSDYSVLSVAFSPDSRRIAIGSLDNSARVLDVESGQEVFALTGHNPAGVCNVGGAAFTPDGRHIVTGNLDITASINEATQGRIWDAASGKLLLTLGGVNDGVNDRLYILEISPDGRRIVTRAVVNTIKVWDAVSGTELATLPTPQGLGDLIICLSFSPDGKRILALSMDGTARVWGATSAKPLPNLGRKDDLFMPLAFSPNGRYLLTVGSLPFGRPSAASDDTAQMRDAVSGALLFTLKGEGRHRVTAASFSPDGRRIAIASDDGTAHVWALQ